MVGIDKSSLERLVPDELLKDEATELQTVKLHIERYEFASRKLLDTASILGGRTDRRLSGVAAETGVVMLIYLDSALKELKEERENEGRPLTRADLHAAIMSGAVERVRPTARP